MTVKHICSMLLVLYPIYRDIKTQQIRFLPGICLIIAGIIARVVSGDISNAVWLLGWLPGAISFLAGKLFGNCIGAGDSFLISGIGVLEGINFCGRMLAITGTVIFIFSVGMMISGKLHRKSKMACVPFLAVGYVGAWLL